MKNKITAAVLLNIFLLFTAYSDVYAASSVDKFDLAVINSNNPHCQIIAPYYSTIKTRMNLGENPTCKAVADFYIWESGSKKSISNLWDAQNNKVNGIQDNYNVGMGYVDNFNTVVEWGANAMDAYTIGSPLLNKGVYKELLHKKFYKKFPTVSKSINPGIKEAIDFNKKIFKSKKLDVLQKTEYGVTVFGGAALMMVMKEQNIFDYDKDNFKNKDQKFAKKVNDSGNKIIEKIVIDAAINFGVDKTCELIQDEETKKSCSSNFKTIAGCWKLAYGNKLKTNVADIKKDAAECVGKSMGMLASGAVAWWNLLDVNEVMRNQILYGVVDDYLDDYYKNARKKPNSKEEVFAKVSDLLDEKGCTLFFTSVECFSLVGSYHNELGIQARNMIIDIINSVDKTVNLRIDSYKKTVILLNTIENDLK